MSMNKQIRDRRVALGLSQGELAERVRAASGSRSFSQQAVASFEKTEGAQSTFLHYIVQVLDEAERARNTKPASKSKPTATEATTDSPYLEALFTEIRRASQDKQREILAFVLSGRAAETPRHGRIINHNYTDLFDDFDEVIVAGEQLKTKLEAGESIELLTLEIQQFIPDAVAALQQFRERATTFPDTSDKANNQAG